MAEVSETKLPGLGVRYDFVTSEGQRLGVVHHRSGRREVVLFDEQDPDASLGVVRLDEDDSRTLAELLGSSRIVRELSDLQQDIKGLAIDWLPVADGTPYAGKSIADTRARTRTGASIVAVLRGEAAHPAPDPDFVLSPGDVLVVVGTPRGIEELVLILRTG
jgi:TrkA domain protein